MHQLLTRLSAMTDDSRVHVPVIPSMSSDQINRQTTERYDRLRAERRAVLGM
jgi:hypothetical protein